MFLHTFGVLVCSCMGCILAETIVVRHLGKPTFHLFLVLTPFGWSFSRPSELNLLLSLKPKPEKKASSSPAAETLLGGSGAVYKWGYQQGLGFRITIALKPILGDL